MPSIQANVAQHKEAHPELYCPERRCLWRTGDGSRCPRHVKHTQDCEDYALIVHASTGDDAECICAAVPEPWQRSNEDCANQDEYEYPGYLYDDEEGALD